MIWGNLRKGMLAYKQVDRDIFVFVQHFNPMTFNLIDTHHDTIIGGMVAPWNSLIILFIELSGTFLNISFAAKKNLNSRPTY